MLAIAHTLRRPPSGAPIAICQYRIEWPNALSGLSSQLMQEGLIDAEKAKAGFKSGLLTVRLTKVGVEGFRPTRVNER